MKNSMASRFQAGNGEAIEFNGRLVRPLFQIEARGREKLIVARKIAKKSPRQGLRIKAKESELEVNDQCHQEIILWADTSPDRVEIAVHAKPGCQLKFWNVWEIDGIVQAWVGNSGMVVTENDDRIVMECSDGTGETDFVSLVVEIEIR